MAVHDPEQIPDGVQVTVWRPFNVAKFTASEKISIPGFRPSTSSVLTPGGEKLSQAGLRLKRRVRKSIRLRILGVKCRSAMKYAVTVSPKVPRAVQSGSSRISRPDSTSCQTANVGNNAMPIPSRAASRTASLLFARKLPCTANLQTHHRERGSGHRPEPQARCNRGSYGTLRPIPTR